ncbi:helix-turn-helix transcriptional regulator [Thiothrix lacustris]|uniref:helix-turn-helix transcriptional regulator n=1 Tax=Thiothrix lacustris TaxID=525917 RepID=UPI00048A8B02|nr:hypothetical protein [Thiothrix lacustris]
MTQNSNNAIQNDPLIIGYAGLQKELHLSRWTLRRHLDKGLLPPAIRLSQMRLAWRKSTLDAWLNAGGIK